MPHANNIVQLRQRIVEAQNKGLFGSKSDAAFAQAVLLELLNDAERSRQSHLVAAERARSQAIAEENQAKGISAVSSMVFNVLNGYINKAMEDAREIEEREIEEREDEEPDQSPEVPEDSTWVE